MSRGLNLLDKVIFVSGASRGIGRSIALRAAQDGAKVVVAAKTKVPHPKLPGTIFTVADEIEKIGGKALPCVVDIRYEEQVQSAVDEAVKKFGGIDILVNNASAISLTNTLTTSMKTFDLMMGINTRGTYLCSKVCIPHLQKSSNAHILNISPPLNMSPKWFSNHVAYTTAKYGMSMCVLGMAGELQRFGIAVNALWPRTAIETAATRMLGDFADSCRRPEIMSDAAYTILTQSAKDPANTGRFLVDEDLLREHGVTDFEQYSVKPGAKLMLDFFLDAESTDSSESAVTDNVKATFERIQGMLSAEAVKSVNSTFFFKLTGDEPGEWYLDLKTESGRAGPASEAGKSASEFDTRFEMSASDFVRMFSGQLKPTEAFMAGTMTIDGDIFSAMSLEKLMKKTL